MSRVMVDVITRPTAKLIAERDLSPDVNPCQFMAPRCSASTAAALCHPATSNLQSLEMLRILAYLLWGGGGFFFCSILFLL